MALPCSYCMKTFLSLRILHRHVKKMHINTKEVLKTNEPKVLKTNEPTVGHTCKTCDKTFLRAGNLGRHMYQFHIKKRKINQCSTNDESKTRDNVNKKNEQVHNAGHNKFMIPTYGCSLCAFTGNQQRHVKIHQSHKHRSQLNGDNCFVTNNDVKASKNAIVSRIEMNVKKRKKKANKFTKLKSKCARMKAIKAVAKGHRHVLASKKKVYFSAAKGRKSKIPVSVETVDNIPSNSDAGLSGSLDDSSCTNDTSFADTSEFESLAGRTTTITSSHNVPYPVMLFDGQAGLSLASSNQLSTLHRFIPTEIQYGSSMFTYNDNAETTTEITQQPLPTTLTGFHEVHIKSEPDPNSLDYGQTTMSANQSETTQHIESNPHGFESTHSINQIDTGSPRIMGNQHKRRCLSSSPRCKNEHELHSLHNGYGTLSPRSHVVYLNEPLFGRSDDLVSNIRENFILRPTENVPDHERTRATMDSEIPHEDSCTTCFKKSYTNIGQDNQLVKGLVRFWKQQRLCDAQLTSGNTVLKVHKLVLTTSSPTCLRIAESSSMAKTLDIHLPSDLGAAALHAVVGFMYEGVLSLTEDTVTHVNRIAKILKLDAVISHCSEFHNDCEEEYKRRVGFTGTAVCDLNADSDKLIISSTSSANELMNDAVADNVMMNEHATGDGNDKYVEVVELSDREAPPGPPVCRLTDSDIASIGLTEQPVTMDTRQPVDAEDTGDDEHVNEQLPDMQESDIDVSVGKLSKAYTMVDHPAQLSGHIAKMWREERLCDAQIRLGQHTVKTHKLVLASASPMVDTLMEKLPIHLSLELRLPSDLPLHALQTFLQCLYDGQLNLTEQNHDHISKIATILKINYISDFCSDFNQLLLESSETNNNESNVFCAQDAAQTDV